MNSDDDVSAAAPGTAASTSASHSANPTRFTTLFYPIAANAQTDSEQPARRYCRGMVAARQPQIRPCGDDEREAILAIVNAAAEAYRYAIPADRWHEPYMSLAELDEEIAAGVAFWGHEAGGELVGIMGIQPVRDVHLIRHAYVRPDRQRGGVGGALLELLVEATEGRILVGTW